MGATNTKCSAGQDHAAIKACSVAFAALKYVGQQFTPADDFGPAELLELRNCSCGNTMTRDITAMLSLKAAA